MSKCCQISTELLPFISVGIGFNRFSSNFVYELILGQSGMVS